MYANSTSRPWQKCSCEVKILCEWHLTTKKKICRSLYPLIYTFLSYRYTRHLYYNWTPLTRVKLDPSQPDSEGWQMMSLAPTLHWKPSRFPNLRSTVRLLFLNCTDVENIVIWRQMYLQKIVWTHFEYSGSPIKGNYFEHEITAFVKWREGENFKERAVCELEVPLSQKLSYWVAACAENWVKKDIRIIVTGHQAATSQPRSGIFIPSQPVKEQMLSDFTTPTVAKHG
jgi:hypothetical protein